MSEAPRLSVVMITPDKYARLRKSISYLEQQPECGQIELILVSPGELPDPPADGWRAFARVVPVRTGPFRGIGYTAAEGVRHATAPVVVVVEDHTFVGEGWVAALLDRHRESWAGVAPAMKNANPGPISWAEILLDFGPAVHPITAGPSNSAPWHHTSYKRELLLAFDSELERMLAAEVWLQSRLVEAGHRFWLEERTWISHVNISSWGSFLKAQFAGGRLYGTSRAAGERWGALRRIFFACAGPLIPLRRSMLLARHAKRTGAPVGNLAFLTACVCGLTFACLGEISGYLFGEGTTRRIRLAYEYDRRSHVRSEDLAGLERN